MVGLRYTIGELARPLRDIYGVAIALVTNFVLVPLLALRRARPAVPNALKVRHQYRNSDS